MLLDGITRHLRVKTNRLKITISAYLVSATNHEKMRSLIGNIPYFQHCCSFNLFLIDIVFLDIIGKNEIKKSQL